MSNPPASPLAPPDLRPRQADFDRLLEAARLVVANGTCSDPDCCAVARAHDAAVKALEEAITAIDEEDGQ